MKSPILLLSFVILSFASLAQNYSPVTPGTTRYFINADGYLRGMRIDSIIPADANLLYYPYRSVRGFYNPTQSTTLDSAGGSWWGKKIIKQPNGIWLFDNIWHDTVVINAQAHLGQAWIFYDDSTDLHYRAEIILEDTSLILGGIDSIKKIRITAHNTVGPVTSDPVHNKEIILTKNLGFAQILDLHTFPYHHPNQSYTTGIDYFLDYSSNQDFSGNMMYSLTHFRYPNDREMMNWQVGDVVQYKYKEANHFANYKYRYDSVMEVTTTLDYTYYSIFRKIETAQNLGPVWYSANYTTPVTILTDSFYFTGATTTYLPEEYHRFIAIYYNPLDQTACFTSPSYTIKPTRIINSSYDHDMSLSHLHYTKEGIGLVYDYVAGTFGQEYELIYSRRGNNPCGTYSALSVNNNLLSTTLTIYPNPANETLFIKNPTQKNLYLSLSNIYGQQIFTTDSKNETIAIPTANLAPGIYSLRTTNTEGQSTNASILIQH